MAGDELQQIVCCFGQPVAGNPTQFMMEKAFARADLDWRYLTLEVPPEALGDAVRGLRAMGFRGGNLTIPHKVAVIPLLDRLTPAAAMMGAVNTMIREGNELVGENTDGKGFVESLRTLVDPAGKKVVLLGAGGAARAIAIETALAGAAQFTVVNRSTERGETLAKLVSEKTGVPTTFVPWIGDYAPPPETDVLINCRLHDRRGDMHGGRRRLQPRGNAVSQGRQGPRVQDARRPRHARQPGSDRLQTLDGRGTRHERDARRGRGVSRGVGIER